MLICNYIFQNHLRHSVVTYKTTIASAKIVVQVKCVKDLDTLILVKFASVGLVLGSSHFFANAPAASKNDAPFKSGQNRLENHHLASLA